MGEGEPGPIFVVGVSRSGTTLLMAMLMAGTRIALTPEWRFVPALLRAGDRGASIDATLVALRRHLGATSSFLDFDLIEARLRERPDATAADAVRLTMQAYAARIGKERWGDKTPNNLVEMPRLAKAFPDARFVHIVRDGREVADANRDAPWPPRSLRFWAGWWSSGIRTARRDGAALGDSYLEVRYEDLIEDTAAALARVFAFVDEPAPADPLTYLEHAERYRALLPSIHEHLADRPTPNLRPWRTKWSRRERVDVEAILGPQLDALGYARSVPNPTAARRLVMTGWYYLHVAGLRLRSSIERLPVRRGQGGRVAP